MEILTHVGGTPGKDCGGFCKFCYFKTVNFKDLDSVALGCKFCPPQQIGCSYCHELIREVKNGFKSPNEVLTRLVMNLEQLRNTQQEVHDLKINVGSWADVINYPYLHELLAVFQKYEFPVNLGYTSGKGIKGAETADELVDRGVTEVSFSVFSMNPDLRREWMRDKTPEKSLEALQRLCELCEVNASTVVVPGVITKEEIIDTCSILEEWGIKSFVLSRFANHQNQGLLFNYKPVEDGIESQPYQEFYDLVGNIAREFSFRVLGSPAADPDKGLPYILARRRNRKYLEQLPAIESEATIITSSLSAPFMEKIFQGIDGNGNVNILAVNKDIGDLIVPADLEEVDLKFVKSKAILPGGALLHDKEAHQLLNRDDKNRTVVRGPELLFLPSNVYLNGKEEEFIAHELRSFTELINLINAT
ncbi:methanogenesis marker radical SAM protein [Methanobacterium sp. CWC-01]|uniref:methyl coenzyme M reductase-arginine methyltransferase Mmp10 n=1 Tax=Methanobacterium aridiramus TaxID=2584467 RepID=UPI0025779739|nr:methyl coenzyme M reductase-arginine methyltransferase Mmp10 [Methanobacterium sp. CWC-01]WJI08654.1 methanogenesis marker radical SAM protein [Methanobacterium sp. CWC-01]